MCIICVKERGKTMPNMSVIEQMWFNNPDGAGIMYTDSRTGADTVRIDKGFMELKSFKEFIEGLEQRLDLTNESVVMHFRIGTHGGNVPANTHPFPMSKKVEDLQRLHTSTPVGIVHNGIIHIEPSRKDISDTMEYIKSHLIKIYKKDNRFYDSESWMGKIEKEIGSKMAFLLPNGDIHTIGAFVTDDNGLLYSNSSYMSWRDRWGSYGYTAGSGNLIPYYYHGSYGWQYDEYDEDDNDVSFCDKIMYTDKLMRLPDGAILLDPHFKIFYQETDFAYGVYMDDMGNLFAGTWDYDSCQWGMTIINETLRAYDGRGKRVNFDKHLSVRYNIFNGIASIEDFATPMEINSDANDAE